MGICGATEGARRATGVAPQILRPSDYSHRYQRKMNTCLILYY